MTYIRIDGREVQGLTEEERRSLHESKLGRPPTWVDVRKIVRTTFMGPVVHHIDRRSRCDGCIVSVYTWAEESTLDGFTGRRFCRHCAKHREQAMFHGVN
jgi:hypothetical protein